MSSTTHPVAKHSVPLQRVAALASRRWPAFLGVAVMLAGCGGPGGFGPGSSLDNAPPPVSLAPPSSASQTDAAPARMPIDEAELHKAIERYRISLNRQVGAIRTAGLDLNGDGRGEVLVLFGGADWCIKTGCSFVVFQQGRFGYQAVSRTTRVWPPVRIGPGSAYGWRDLIIKTGGGGAPVRDVRLGFAGNGYPSNALLQPQPREDVLAKAAEVIPDAGFMAAAAASEPAAVQTSGVAR